MGADEPLTNREIREKFGEIRDDKKNFDERLTNLAKDTVSTEAWARENGHIQRNIAEVDAHCEERHKIVMKALDDLKASTEKALGEVKKTIEKRSEITWTRALGILSILAVLIAAWYTALHQGGH